MKRRRADLALAGVTCIWGATFTLVKDALQDSSTLLFLAMRFSLAAVVLALVFRRPAARPAPSGPPTGRALFPGVLAGLCLYVAYWLQTAGLRFTTPSKSAFLTALCVVMVPLLAAAVYRVWPSPSEGLGVATATAGMALLTLPGFGVQVNPGDLLTVGAAFGFAVHVMVVGHFSPTIGFERLSVVQIATVAALTLASFWWAEPVMARWSVRLAFAVLVTGLLCTALAFTVQAWAQQHTTPTRTALIFTLEPVAAWVTSYLAVGEVLPVRAGIGALLILAGILVVELKPGRAGGHP